MKENTGIVVKFPSLTSPILVIKPELQQLVTDLTIEAAMYHEVNAENYEAANEFYSRLVKVNKQIEAQRKEVKAPITALGKAVDSAVTELTTPLDVEKSTIEKLIATEYRRQQAEILKAQQEQQRKEQEARNAAEKAANDGDAIGVIQASLKIDEAKTESTMLKAASKSIASTVTIAKIKQLVVDDASKIPYSINNVILLTPNEVAIKALLLAGVSVPGCHIEEVDSIRSRG